jgi:hypothetical protein
MVVERRGRGVDGDQPLLLAGRRDPEPMNTGHVRREPPPRLDAVEVPGRRLDELPRRLAASIAGVDRAQRERRPDHEAIDRLPARSRRTSVVLRRAPRDQHHRHPDPAVVPHARSVFFRAHLHK